MKKVEEIKRAVMENAKKGKLTTTKYVGTYNYKSGFDNYFALSFDKKGEVIVYSFYENDRGEYLDTYTIKLSELDEKVLNEVYENLNTKDEKTLSLLEWYEEQKPSLYTHNTAILIHLGIIKPSQKTKAKKETYTLDLKSLPKLENDKDAYYINRNHKVGVLKYVGEVPETFYPYNGKTFASRIYSYDGTKKLTQRIEYCKGKPALYGYLDKKAKNKGCFSVLNKDKFSYYAYILVPNEEELVKLFKKANKANEHNEVYVISATRAHCFKSKYAPEEIKERYKGKDNVIIFFNKNEALAKFEEVRKEILNKIDLYNNLLKDLLNTREELVKGFEREKEYEVEVNTLKVGDKFVMSKDNADKAFTISSIDEYGVVHVIGGGVIFPTDSVLPYDKLEDAMLEEQYSFLRKDIRDIKYLIEYINSKKEEFIEYTPLLDEAVVCSMENIERLYNDYKLRKYNL